MSNADPSAEDESAAQPGFFSRDRLSAAFARLTGTAQPNTDEAAADASSEEDDVAPETRQAELISPQTIVEAMLFVGSEGGTSLTAREMASHVRDVSPREVDSVVAQLNQEYLAEETAYEIVSEGAGYRMQLRRQFGSVRDRITGRLCAAKLSAAAVETLSVVAYRQPVTAEQVTQLRGNRSHAVLAQLVRRGLVRLERPNDTPRRPRYFTTDRFNQLLQIESASDLPASGEVDDG